MFPFLKKLFADSAYQGRGVQTDLQQLDAMGVRQVVDII
jgi:hypothetical protein